ncbi:MAG TPA: NADH-quinone oxidoreductase subunit C [Patescibacteria group bacterium]|nr:NADH-quinone oxidoreductase subunit C [Patescibacteria group bacterium]
MSTEENIVQELVKNFGYLENKVRLARPRRLFLDVDLAHFEEVFAYAVQKLKFSHLISITGLDEQDNLSFLYHLAQKGVMLNIKTSAPKDNPVIKTVMSYFPGAEIYERELVDLFGAKVEGLPAGNRYPLTDDWPAGEFPLRKDWKGGHSDA